MAKYGSAPNFIGGLAEGYMQGFKMRQQNRQFEEQLKQEREMADLSYRRAVALSQINHDQALEVEGLRQANRLQAEKAKQSMAMMIPFARIDPKTGRSATVIRQPNGTMEEKWSPAPPRPSVLEESMNALVQLAGGQSTQTPSMPQPKRAEGGPPTLPGIDRLGAISFAKPTVQKGIQKIPLPNGQVQVDKYENGVVVDTKIVGSPKPQPKKNTPKEKPTANQAYDTWVNGNPATDSEGFKSKERKKYDKMITDKEQSWTDFKNWATKRKLPLTFDTYLKKSHGTNDFTEIFLKKFSGSYKRKDLTEKQGNKKRGYRIVDGVKVYD